MTLEQLIQQQVEDNLKKATRLSTEAALTLDIWLRAIDREKAEVYSAVADGLLTALMDAEDIPANKKPAGVGSPTSRKE